jgi:hypothetical protein
MWSAPRSRLWPLKGPTANLSRQSGKPFWQSTIPHYRGEKRGDGIGYSGHKHQKGDKVTAITDNHGSILAPVPVAPVNEIDMVLLLEGLKALKQVAKDVGVDLRGAYVNLDGGFDSAHNRKCIFNAGMIPNIKENPLNRKTTKRGRKRLFNEAIHAGSLVISGVPNYLIFQANKAYPDRSRWIRWNKCLTFRIP